MKIVIIGAGPAGVMVAETLRQYDKQSKITMLSSEPFPPYSPPALIEHFLSEKDVHFWRGKDFPDRLGIDYRPKTQVTGIIPRQRTIRLINGETIPYERLVIATGSRLYAPIHGADMEGVYNFKSLSAAKKLMQRVREGQARKALIVGSGFIGVEIALLLRRLRLEVTLIEMADKVMPAMLDHETAEIALGLIQGQGIRVLLNAKVIAFLGNSRVKEVELEGGKRLKADIVAVSTGVKPNIEFLDGSGIETRLGIPVDNHLCTNIPEIYAAGDVAETMDRITGERYLHPIFPNAVAQGKVVAFNLLGQDVSYEGADNMNSLKHLDLPIIAAGRMEGEELKMKRDGILRKLYIKDDRVLGFRLAGDIRAAGLYRMLMNKKVNVRRLRHRLLEPGFGMGYVEAMATPGGPG